MNGLTLDKLAEQAGLDIDVVQFYERSGLIKTPPKTVANHQFYPQEEVSRLRFITRAQKLGFSLNEIKELLFLKSKSHASKNGIKSKIFVKIQDVQNKMLDLYRIKGALEHLASGCDDVGTACGCQIIEALDPDTQERLGRRHDHIEF